eukprot:8121266-Pyramimonas_sp.AAC.2
MRTNRMRGEGILFLHFTGGPPVPITANGCTQHPRGRGYIPTGRTNQTSGEGIYLQGGRRERPT